MKFIITLCISYFWISIIYYFYIILIEHFHLNTIFFQSLFPRFNLGPINQIFLPNLILNNIQNCLIKLWCGYHFLSTEISFTLSRCRWISCHISIITNICHTIIIRFFIPNSRFITYIIKIFSIYHFKIAPKIWCISFLHPIWSLNTILTVCSIQKSSNFITRYWILIWKRNNIQSNFRQPFHKRRSIYISYTQKSKNTWKDHP